jgi:hypothetical protein
LPCAELQIQEQFRRRDPIGQSIRRLSGRPVLHNNVQHDGSDFVEAFAAGGGECGAFGAAEFFTARWREAWARVSAGETQRSVARSYNVSQSTISRLE